MRVVVAGLAEPEATTAALENTYFLNTSLKAQTLTMEPLGDSSPPSSNLPPLTFHPFPGQRLHLRVRRQTAGPVLGKATGAGNPPPSQGHAHPGLLWQRGALL